MVDDDQKVREMLRDALEARYDVTVEANAGAALERLGQLGADVVLLDVDVPGIDGLDVLREIRARDASLPVVVVTGVSEIHVVEEMFRLGAFAYLPKPFQVAYVEHLVRTALAQRRG